jgi:ABC-2 type transport system ATP-binding protein
MREGTLLADDTLPGLLERTGTADVEAAFLALVDRAGRDAGVATSDAAATRRTHDDQTSGSLA